MVFDDGPVGNSVALRRGVVGGALDGGELIQVNGLDGLGHLDGLLDAPSATNFLPFCALTAMKKTRFGGATYRQKKWRQF